jgi:AcrR family transcriptional regulator
MRTDDESRGRVRQKQRTRAALVAATLELVAAGGTPTVAQAADRAGVSRTTAYRYFPNQQSILLAAHPETARRTLLPAEPPSRTEDRLDAVVTSFLEIVLETEAAQRTMLRLSLDPDPAARGQLPLRQGRAIGWIGEALTPLHGRFTAAEIHRLTVAIRSAVGIEALIWLTDIAGLSRTEAVESMRWSARAMLQAAVSAGPPPAPGNAD